MVVTRYFGGTCSAPEGSSVHIRLPHRPGSLPAPIIEKQFGKKLHLTTDYTGIGKLQYLIAQNQVFTLDTRYTDSVTIDLMVPEEKFADFCAQVTEATSGQAQMDSEDLEEFGIVNGEIIF